MKKIVLIIAAIVVLIVGGFLLTTFEYNTDPVDSSVLNNITIDGHYNSKMEVASYIHEFHKLPNNYMTKEKAKSVGWKGGSLDAYLSGYAIGGDVFTNRQGVLPGGHKYIECDINTNGQSDRGAERIVYSTDDFKIYYTDDHYATFTEITF